MQNWTRRADRALLSTEDLNRNPDFCTSAQKHFFLPLLTITPPTHTYELEKMQNVIKQSALLKNSVHINLLLNNSLTIRSIIGYIMDA